ncbi:MAG: hypothetical protein Q4F65_05575 [Propionibacteriaceae bacterium]|nr:hypothetical protein [Propionibacteriaceae bacterium]
MDAIVLLASVPAIVAVVNLAKRLGLNGEASLVLAVALGVAFALADHLWGDTGWYAATSSGLVLGLGAAGLYDVTAPHATTDPQHPAALPEAYTGDSKRAATWHDGSEWTP